MIWSSISSDADTKPIRRGEEGAEPQGEVLDLLVNIFIYINPYLFTLHNSNTFYFTEFKPTQRPVVVMIKVNAAGWSLFLWGHACSVKHRVA